MELVQRTLLITGSDPIFTKTHEKKRPLSHEKGRILIMHSLTETHPRHSQQSAHAQAAVFAGAEPSQSTLSIV